MKGKLFSSFSPWKTCYEHCPESSSSESMWKKHTVSWLNILDETSRTSQLPPGSPAYRQGTTCINSSFSSRLQQGWHSELQSSVYSSPLTGIIDDLHLKKGKIKISTMCLPSFKSQSQVNNMVLLTTPNHFPSHFDSILFSFSFLLSKIAVVKLLSPKLSQTVKDPIH